MLFDEMKLDTVTHNGGLYVNVEQLATYLTKAVKEFILGSAQLSQFVPMDARETAFCAGVVEGMESICMLLRQGNDEHNIGTIDTIEELLERFKDVSS